MALMNKWTLCFLAVVNVFCTTVYVNPAHRVFLNGTATRVGAAGLNVRNVSWTIVAGSLSADSLLGSPENNAVVGIRENVLLPDRTYVFRFAGRRDDGSVIEDEVVFSARSAPSGGSVLVSPSSGVVGLTEFSISTSGWSSGDSDGGLMKYRFSYKTNMSDLEVPLTIFSPSTETHDIVFEQLHSYATEVTVIARAMNAYGVVSNVSASTVVIVHPNPVLSSATSGLLQRWRHAVRSQNLTSILRSGCLLSAVLADTNATTRHSDNELVLGSISESISNLTAVAAITSDVADLASHALAQTALSVASNDTAHLETTLHVLQQISAGSASKPQDVTNNGTIAQGSVTSPEFASNAVKTISAVMASLATDNLPRPDVDTIVGNALEVISEQHLVGRVCGEDMVLSNGGAVQLLAGVRAGESLSSLQLNLPSGSFSLPDGFFSQSQTPFNQSCVPVRAYVLPINIQASSSRIHFLYNTTDGSQPKLSSPTDDMGADQEALFDVSGNYGYTEGSYVQYVRLGADDTGVDGIKFNFSQGMVVGFQLPTPVTGESIRCAYKENILDEWQSDNSCQLTLLNDTYAECTCYHASAIVIQSAPVCTKRTTCADAFVSRFPDCPGCNAYAYAFPIFYTECSAYPDGCGDYIFCGGCYANEVSPRPVKACVPSEMGCVDFNHSAAIALAAEHCLGRCGFTQFTNGGSTICSCPAGSECVKGSCKALPTCAALNKTCGVWPAGVAGVVGPCGSCPAGQYCNGVGQCAVTPPPPPCVPLSTCPANSCGGYPDGCGGKLNCGGCPGALKCNTSNLCGTGCGTCWEIMERYLRPDDCACHGPSHGLPLWAIEDWGCYQTVDDCGNTIHCGYCMGVSLSGFAPPVLVADCTPDGCLAQPYNETAMALTPWYCEQDCKGRCGWTVFPSCGSKMCTCPSGQVCSNGYCAVVQKVGVNWAAGLDGGTGYWTAWSAPSTVIANFTLSMWVYATGMKTKDQYIFYNGVAQTNGWGLKIAANYPMNISVLLGGTGGPPVQEAFKYKLPIQQWTYITVINTNGTNWQLYENATLKALFTLAARVVVPSSKFTVGGSWDAGATHLNGNFDGRVDELQLWHRVLTPGELWTNFKNGVSGFEPNLVIYMPFSEGSGSRTYLVGTGASLGVVVNITGTNVSWKVRANNTNASWVSSGGQNVLSPQLAVKQIEVLPLLADSAPPTPLSDNPLERLANMLGISISWVSVTLVVALLSALMAIVAVHKTVVAASRAAAGVTSPTKKTRKSTAGESDTITTSPSARRPPASPLSPTRSAGSGANGVRKGAELSRSPSSQRRANEDIVNRR